MRPRETEKRDMRGSFFFLIVLLLTAMSQSACSCNGDDDASDDDMALDDSADDTQTVDDDTNDDDSTAADDSADDDSGTTTVSTTTTTNPTTSTTTTFTGMTTTSTIMSTTTTTSSTTTTTIGAAGPLNGPVEIDGDGDPEYVYIEFWEGAESSDEQTHIRVEVREIPDDTVVWSQQYDLLGLANLYCQLKDLDGDGSFEIIEPVNVKTWNDATSQWDYSGWFSVFDGDNNFAVSYDSGVLENQNLTAYPGYDMNRNGLPEICIKTTPQAGTAAVQTIAWYEIPSGYSVVKQFNAEPGHDIGTGLGFNNGSQGPIDIDGDGELEYLFIDHYQEGSQPHPTQHYTMEVRKALSDAVVWSRVVTLDDAGNENYALSDINHDGFYEIVEATNGMLWDDQNGRYVYNGEIRIYAGADDYSTIFDTGEWDHQNLAYSFGWDMNRNGLSELVVWTMPEQGSEALSEIIWYEIKDGNPPIFSESKHLVADPGHSIQVVAGPGQNGMGPVNIDGSGNLEYLLIDHRFENGIPQLGHHVIMEVRDSVTDEVVWSLHHDMAFAGTAQYMLNDLNRDGIFEIIETLNDQTWDPVQSRYRPNGRVRVLDGANGFQAVFDTGISQDVNMNTSTGFDMDRNHLAEIEINSWPPVGSTHQQKITFYEIASGYAVVKEFAPPLGHVATVATAMQ